MSAAALLFQVMAEANDLPFWKAKDKIYARVREGEIMVSVKTEVPTATRPQRNLHASGGGIVNASCEYVASAAQNYPAIKASTTILQELRLNEENHHLMVTLSALGRVTHLELEVKASDANVEPRWLAFTVLSGPFTGYRGQLQLLTLSPAVCEVGFLADYLYDQLPVPATVMALGMEAVYRGLAVGLRSKVQSAFRALPTTTESDP